MAAQEPDSTRAGEGGAAVGPRTPVWSRPHAGGRGPRPSLGVEAIVAAAVALADTEGLQAVSMRRIAAELGVGTMSLYRYVETKDDLLDLMTDQVMGEDGHGGEATGDWRADLRALAVRYRQLMLRHPWVLPIGASRPPIGPQTLRRTERLFETLDGLGLAVDQIADLTGTVVAFVRGVVLGETAEAELIRRTGQTRDDYRRAVGPYLTRVLAEGRHPLLARYVQQTEAPPDPDRTFLWSLERVLDGIAAGIAGLREETGAPAVGADRYGAVQ